MVPEDWINSKLDEIGVIRSGSTPARSQQSRYFAEEGIPWVKTMDLNNGVIHHTDEHITESAIRETSCRVFPAGSVLVAMYGGFNQIGRTGLLAMNAATNQAISVIQLDHTLADPQYVLSWLNANVEVWKRIAASSRKDPNITRDDVCKFPILLPPLAEQRKIAEILSAWDRAIDLTTQLIAAKQQRKRGLMQQLLTGKRRFPEFAGKEWKRAKISDLLVESRIPGSNGTVARKITVRLYGKGVVPKEEKRAGSEATKYYVRKAGQLIYSTLDFLNGAFGIIPADMDGYESTADLPCFDFKPNVNPQFLLYFVSREAFYSRFAASALGGRKARRIPADEFLASAIVIPDILEQRRIAAVLQACDQEIALLEQKLDLLQQQKHGLMQQLLTGRVRV